MDENIIIESFRSFALRPSLKRQNLPSEYASRYAVGAFPQLRAAASLKLVAANTNLTWGLRVFPAASRRRHH